MKLSKKQLTDIAESIDAGFICYLNAETGEYIEMMNNDAMSNYGISWEEEEDEEPGDFSHQWEKELYDDVKSDMAKIDSWEHAIKIEKPESHESFKIMERFVDEIIPDGKLKNDFFCALSRSHPFRNFNALVHNCKYREDWFAFKQNAIEEYVRAMIDEYVSLHLNK